MTTLMPIRRFKEFTHLQGASGNHGVRPGTHHD